jgi:hypothetical protein
MTTCNAASGPALFNAIVTAFDLGIFSALEATPGVDLPQLAERTGIPAGKLRVLMFALCSTGLVCPREGGYANAELASEFLAHDGPDSWSHILAKAFAVLRPGGRVLIYGFNASPHETDGIYAARLALYLTTLATGNGMTYPATDYEKWLHSVGFEEIHTISGLAYEHGLTSGRKLVDTDGFT